MRFNMISYKNTIVLIIKPELYSISWRFCLVPVPAFCLVPVPDAPMCHGIGNGILVCNWSFSHYILVVLPFMPFEP